MFFGTGNINCIYEVCKKYFGLKQGTQRLEEYFFQVMGICEELNMYQPITFDTPYLLQQHEYFNVVHFFIGLKLEHEHLLSQILSSSKLTSLLYVFFRL